MAFTDADIASAREAAQKGGEPEALYKLGLIYSSGQGDQLDFVQAHMWFNLAAMRGVEAAKMSRKELADHMTTTQVAAALKAAREWLDRPH